MPFMHSEKKDNLNTSVKLIQELIDAASEKKFRKLDSKLKTLLKSAEGFADIIKAFDRFPHRNDQLGRRNTNAEWDYFSTGDLPVAKAKSSKSF